MPLNGKRILIVEDENLIVLGLDSEINAAGCEVVATAGSVDAALDLIATTDLDGAIVDVKLRGQLTFLVADALAARRIPFVFTTAMNSRECPARFADVPWLEKPFLPGAALRALSGVMAGCC
jgi:CheY-like chemotaxis protein